jgi:hypothetical protein
MIRYIIPFLFSFQALAAEVRVTQFFPLSENRRVAQVCGDVFPAQEVDVRAVSDYNTSAASVFTFRTTRAGHFCGVIGTYYGRVLLIIDQFETFATLKE